jgi:heme-degrading monooxygenase HmoA
MIVVIFEVVPHEDKAQQYFDLAAGLREELQQVDGFISVERFHSLTTEGKYVSLSFWRDAAAVEAWFSNTNHQGAQAEGRRAIFRDYRIRVAEVLRDYEMASGRPEI